MIYFHILLSKKGIRNEKSWSLYYLLKLKNIQKNKHCSIEFFFIMNYNNNNSVYNILYYKIISKLPKKIDII